ncbi:hypothetical protein EDB83DRAFT_2317882 [Lactarius deliciosus]|nr:hypothetical protein EDB83DRAFT_2317882 [Lactarius deliciosus]
MTISAYSVNVTNLGTYHLIGPPSAIFPSPDTTNRHPFFAISAASAGVSGVPPALSAFSLRPTPVYSAFCILPARRYALLSLMSPPPQPSFAASRLDLRASAADLNMGLATSTLAGWSAMAGILVVLDSATTVGVGPELAPRRKLPIGGLIGPSPHPGRRVACLSSALAYLATLDIRSRSWCRLTAALCARTGLHTREEDIARGSHQCGLGVTSSSRQMSRSARLCVVWYADRMDGMLPMDRAWCSSVDFHSSPSHCVFGAITTIGSGEEMESENGKNREVSLRSGINVLFPSVRAGRTRGFSIRSKVTRDDIMGSAVGEQQERGMSISGQNVPSAQLCLRARDVIQLGHSRVYAETVDELRECFGREVVDVSALRWPSTAAVSCSQRVAIEYGFDIEIRVL